MTKILVTTAAIGMAAALTSMPAQAETFGGPYVGVSVGYDRIEVDDTAIDAEVSRDALSLGGYAGYNCKITERVVIGAEAGINASVDNKIAARSGGTALIIDPLYDFDLSVRWLFGDRQGTSLCRRRLY
ncbi:MAG: porin family protein [Sphingomonadales bacterium]|nr:porin family protein [Sphingomonadales bacterium]NCP50655.1 porin family protein [Sphingomonadales bacterium]